MKIKSPVELNLYFGEQALFELNKEVVGKLTIMPKIDLDIEQIFYRFIVQNRGSLSPTSQQLSEVVLAKETLLKQGTEHTFDLSIFNDQYPTYKGRNVEFLFKVEAYVILRKKETKKGFLAKIFKSDKDRIFKVEKFITFKNKPNLFKVRPSEAKLFQRSFLTFLYYFMALIIFLAISSMLIGDLESLKKFFYTHLEKIQITVAIFMTWFIFYFLLAKILIGKVVAKFKDRNAELLEVNLTSNWNLVHSISVNYYMEEKVRDDRGTSDSIYTHVFYESPKKIIDKPLKRVEILLPYPEQMMPSIELGDAKLYWVFQVKIKTILGIPFLYDGEFFVEK